MQTDLIKSILVLCFFVLTACERDPGETRKLNFAANVLINNPNLYNYNIDEVHEISIFVTKGMKGFRSEKELRSKNLGIYSLNRKQSGEFLRSLCLMIDSGYSCSSVNDEPISLYIVMNGVSRDTLGQFQITKPMGCPDKGFIVTPGAVQELQSWKSFQELLKVYK